MTKEELTKLLWEIDPIRTCCNVNEGMEDEYEKEASMIIDKVAAGLSYEAALIETFNTQFSQELTENYKKEILKCKPSDNISN